MLTPPPVLSAAVCRTEGARPRAGDGGAGPSSRNPEHLHGGFNWISGEGTPAGVSVCCLAPVQPGSPRCLVLMGDACGARGEGEGKPSASRRAGLPLRTTPGWAREV